MVLGQVCYPLTSNLLLHLHSVLTPQLDEGSLEIGIISIFGLRDSRQHMYGYRLEARLSNGYVDTMLGPYFWSS